MSVVKLLCGLSCVLFSLETVLSEHVKVDAFQDTLGHIRPQTPANVQAQAAREVIKRLLGVKKAEIFDVHVDFNCGPVGKDTFKILWVAPESIVITGTSGVAVAWGLHYYLKTYCNVHISWEGNQLNLPQTLPQVDVTVTSNDRFRYYQNVCTTGYSFAWWQWDHWERHIDWMALNGINLALAFNGQEAIWEKVYQELNLTRDEINEHYGGPAFLPWARMGNIRGFGGPLSSSWHAKSITLQRLILQRMRNLGIIPVLPAFAGHVPRAFSRIFPKANMTKIAPWNHFSDRYCCPNLLEPTDPLFQRIGEMFLKMYIEEFGTDHVYNCDTFNEIEPYTSELKYLRSMGLSIYAAMTTVDPKAIWLMQGWLFVHDMMYWTEPRIEALLTSVPMGKMIVLDLQSEQFPQYVRLKSYYGQPFIWCMLHNFGGTLGMFGSAQIINRRVFEARNMRGSTMVGTGLTPEGINQNYVIYELMNEMAYRQEPVDLDNWFENYSSRRYGAWNQYAVAAWKNIAKTVYNFSGTTKIRGKYVLTRRPSLNITPWTWYDPEIFFYSWNIFLQARLDKKNSTLYKHDVIDITRQCIQLKIDDIYIVLMDSFNKKNITAFRSYSNAFLDLFDDLELILATGKDFLLGMWLEQAKSLATTEEEKELYEYNARNQITLWGPRGEIRDYANKQWSGIVADYFKPRWAIFLETLEYSLINGTKPNMVKVNERIFKEVEKPFTLSRKVYPIEAKDDSIQIALSILNKWYEPAEHEGRSFKTIRNSRRRKLWKGSRKY